MQAGLCEAEQEQMRKILYQKESNYNRLKRAKMDKSMFVKIKTLGIGAFGEVCLVCKVDTHALYAMKTLRKKDVLNRNQVAHVKAERDILAEADNEWVVKLYYSFQDKDSLYFVMDYIPGGDMMSLLIRMEVFPEHLARFYIAELTLAIESVHKMGFIHRDIKPDNILIDLDGHIKLTDFGLCTGFRWTHNSKYYQKGTALDTLSASGTALGTLSASSSGTALGRPICFQHLHLPQPSRQLLSTLVAPHHGEIICHSIIFWFGVTSFPLYRNGVKCVRVFSVGYYATFRTVGCGVWQGFCEDPSLCPIKNEP